MAADISEEFAKFKEKLWSSWSDFEKDLQDFEATTSTAYRLDKSDLVKTANNKRQRLGQCLIPDHVKYTRAVYVCCHFGHCQSKSTGQRQCRSFMPTGCTATFTLSYTQKNASLKITDKYSTSHNHELNPEMYDQYPKHRKLTQVQKDIVTDYLQCHPTNSGLLSTVQSRFGKAWTLSDLKNFRQKVKGHGPGGRTDVDDLLGVVESIASNGKVTVQWENDNNTIELVGFTTADMLNLYTQFPEMIFMDGTYKKNNCGFPLYQIMVQDSTGRGRAVFYCFIKAETTASIKQLLEVFRTFVGDVSRTLTLMVDKDYKEINAAQDVLPDVSVLLCHFHVVKAMRSRILQLKESMERREELLTASKRVVYANTEDEFRTLVDQLLTMNDSYAQYFTSNWMNCIPMWASYCWKYQTTFGNNTNNICEAENRQLSTFLTSSTRLSTAVSAILNHNTKLNAERKRTVFHETCRTTILDSMPAGLSSLYSRYTKHACKLMAVNHKRLDNMAVEEQLTSHPQTVSLREGQVIRTVSLEVPSCECSFFKQHDLPCCHMVKCSKEGYLSTDSIVFGRWVKDKCNFPPLEVTGSIPLTLTTQPPPTFRRVEAVLSRATDMIMACGDRQARERLSLIEGIIRKWENGEEVELINSQGGIRVNVTDEAEHVTQVEQTVEADEVEITYPVESLQADEDQIADSEQNMQEENEQELVITLGNGTEQGASLRDLNLRLPRVCKKGNAKRKKTVHFTKSRKQSRKENIQDAMAEDVEPDEAADRCVPLHERQPRQPRSVTKPRGQRVSAKQRRFRNKTDKVVDGRCVECGMVEPPASISSAQDISWIQCDTCSYWYHECCLQSAGIHVPTNTDEQFICVLCRE